MEITLEQMIKDDIKFINASFQNEDAKVGKAYILTFLNSYLEHFENHREEPRGFRDMKVGDILIDEDNSLARVYAVLGDVVCLSSTDRFATVRGWFTIHEVESEGWHLKDSKEVIYEDRDGERETLRTNCVAIDNTSKYPGHGTWTSNEVKEEDELTGDDIESLKTIINHMPIDGLPSDYRGASISYLDMKLNKLLKKRK